MNSLTLVSTPLWIFNKNKPAKKRDKLLLINAANHFSPLNKNKGSKRKEIDERSRKEIVKALNSFQSSTFCKVFDKWHFYYNKQSILLTNIDTNGKSLEEHLPTKIMKSGEEVPAKSIKLLPTKIIQNSKTGRTNITNFNITSFPEKSFESLFDYYEKHYVPLVDNLMYKKGLEIFTSEAKYYFDNTRNTIVEESKGKKKFLGCGKIVVKCNFKKNATKKSAAIEISVELIPDYQKDYEIVQYSPDERENNKRITAFMKEFVSKPFRYLENVVGVEVNFNKIFYRFTKLREVSQVEKEIENIEKEIRKIDKELTI
jgi:type I restriction enzyme M protein